MTKCGLCGVEFNEAPFTIKTPRYTIHNACGNCMNLYAWGVTGDDEHALEVLLEKMAIRLSTQTTNKGVET